MSDPGILGTGTAVDADLCECGHARDRHLLGSGLCWDCPLGSGCRSKFRAPAPLDERSALHENAAVDSDGSGGGDTVPRPAPLPDDPETKKNILTGRAVAALIDGFALAEEAGLLGAEWNTVLLVGLVRVQGHLLFLERAAERAEGKK